ncbi:hypothetical protein Mal4_05410 [Maioricimonas rarisocia]|uniref:Uncharacterized protein n=1 Tax=Maioricimonas rarisocia TaxID=2528026 RepID=A0A517Z196_9PLAN|nr:hypothetical protein [Maioricimonas rarisocia]QDU36257.1 hypothetical protein Mal4_05410 [Maioricimonas rarisocia]
MNQRIRDGLRPVALGVAALAGLWLHGCGSEVYEQRLQETAAFFAYMDKLNDNLEPVWRRQDFGLSMRPPKPFQLMPAPVPPEVEEGEEPPPVEDTRQPVFLGTELPGLIEAWRADLPSDGGEQVPAFLYFLGNHQRFLDLARSEGVGADPATFLSELEIVLQQALGVTLPEGESRQADPNTRYRERLPKEERYAIPKDFTAIDFEPPEPIGGVPLRLHLYQYQTGQVQVALLMVYPADVRDRPQERLKLALETLNVSGQAPRPQRSSSEGEAGGASPGRPGRAF